MFEDKGIYTLTVQRGLWPDKHVFKQLQNRNIIFSTRKTKLNAI